MVNSLKMKMLYVTLGTALAASSASAKVYVNSMCYMKANSAGQVIEGDQKKKEKFPLASISKVVTSLWAVEKLGPDYRFKTKLHVTRVGNDTYDVHIEGGRDPIFGRNSSYFLISELNRLSIPIKKIETLTFDENFLLDWLSEESPRIGGDTPYYDTIEKQADAVRNSLIADFASAIRKDRYDSLKNKAARIGVTMASTPTISVRRVEFKPKSAYTKPEGTQTLVYKSAPLRVILKRMNNQSNNYIADTMYWNLGGTTAFQQFIKNSLSMNTDEMEFYLGSGNNANYIYNPNTDIYNEATCEAMVKVLYKLDKNLEKSGYELSEVMAVAGVDSDSTVASYGGNFAGSTTAKTGSVNKAKTLAGTVSTKNGEIYFAVLMHTDNRTEWGSANATIKKKVNQLIVDNGGAKSINYKETLPLAFDKGSSLATEISANKNKG
ncbi:D-alanyl-D-alanine carboxypeptidase [Bdellovibrio sp. 22V]|uniref:D-alanyl-D-alanine carboxypeptidase n=1 Tax=Bdellovibrio TaxID=958 RepID=UPI0025430727|nr:D-alanyl-D-alanine carboxypeptidase [Bdellovibrio sp. 22V]WII72443.1 D-alanyl-D-alanine carboxypeptidase [Bdellovibrio sp. 22V]